MRAAQCSLTARLLAATLAVLACACGGGGGGGNGGVIPGGRTAAFTADDSTPPNGSLSLQNGGSNGDIVSVRVAATNTADFFGAAFHVLFDPAVVAFVDFDSSSSFLRDTASGLDFRVTPTAAGDLSVVATRQQNGSGSLSGIDVAGTRTLIVLRFRALTDTAGTSVDLDDPREARDSADVVIPVTWFGGTVTAQ